MNTLLSYTGYEVMNRNNIFNVFIFIFDNIDDQEKLKKFSSYIKINIGLQFWNNLVLYTTRKVPNHPILKL